MSPSDLAAVRPLAPTLVALCLVLASGCAEEAPPTEISEGQALYEAHCSSCHGEGALGDGPLASTLPVEPPSILEHLGHHTQAQLNRLIGEGIPPAMPPSPLTDGQIGQIVDYAWTLVPESEVAALREMQAQMEAMGEEGMGGMPGMPGMEMETDSMEMGPGAMEPPPAADGR